MKQRKTLLNTNQDSMENTNEQLSQAELNSQNVSEMVHQLSKQVASQL